MWCLGTYEVTLIPSTSGVVVMHVSISSTAISSSPFKLTLHANDEEARKDPQFLADK
jgi:hypothetical protein